MILQMKQKTKFLEIGPCTFKYNFWDSHNRRKTTCPMNILTNISLSHHFYDVLMKTKPYLSPNNGIGSCEYPAPLKVNELEVRHIGVIDLL